MIEPLRKKHFRIWLLIGILLPVLTFSAYLMAPAFPQEGFTEQHITFPELLRSMVSENYVFNIKKNYGGGNILEITHISKFNPASELVTIRYRKKFPTEEMQSTLGIMGGMKTYLFNLKDIQTPFSVTVTDTINNMVLAKIDF